MERRFAGKVVIVTGAAGGIGRAAVERLIAEGAQVAAVDADSTRLEEITSAYAADSTDLLCIQADVTQSEEVRRYVERVEGRFGGVDCLFNNAGIEGAVAPIDLYPEDVFEQVLAVNVTGVFLAMKSVVPALRRRGGGAIVNTASVAGLAGAPSIPAYSASKHAVLGLTRSAAMTYASEKIRVNAVCPGPIETRMMRSLEEGMADTGVVDPKGTVLASIPAGRYGGAEEVAALVAFLLSDDARYVNGAAYTLDGAMTAG